MRFTKGKHAFIVATQDVYKRQAVGAGGIMELMERLCECVEDVLTCLLYTSLCECIRGVAGDSRQEHGG